MNFPKRVNIFLLLFLAALNITLRYPKLPHELGFDSFFIHGLANSILIHEYAKWILHPFSYFGLYPLSYPGAYPFFAASISAMTGLEVEISIFIVAIIFGLLGVFGTYLLALELKKDHFVCH